MNVFAMYLEYITFTHCAVKQKKVEDRERMFCCVPRIYYIHTICCKFNKDEGRL